MLQNQGGQVSSSLIEEVATPGQEATEAQRILRHFVAAHRAIAFFDLPANGPFRGIVGAIEFLVFGDPKSSNDSSMHSL